ncbi:DUF4203 domain-containing protein [Candidatus Saccharibacteria bacterium]|nr:DUF4203 domain-containing protein [Candidatus Saccharibacteria bacterium]
MNDFLSGLEVWQLIVVMAIGALLMLVGYRIKKVAFFLIWFFIGFLLMQNLMPWINSSFPDIASQDLWQWLLPLCGGLLLALLGFTIEKLCVGGICFGLVVTIAIQQFGTEINVIVISAVVGVVLAGVAVVMMKPAAIIATSLAGAFLVVSALPYVAPAIKLDDYFFLALIGGTVLGSIIQFFTTKHIS